MTAADAWAALLLGIVEGLTEFLPVSSTGHLILAAEALGRSDPTTEIFIVVIQLGAILAVCWHFRQRIFALLGSLMTRPTQLFALRIVAAFLPAAVVGLAFHDTIKRYLFSPLTVAAALIVGGVIIIVIERRQITEKVATIDDMRMREAWWVGIAQVLALFPGVSRAAATIMGGRLTGMSRSAATEFSFFLAIPVMFAASALDLSQGWEQLNQDDLAFIGLGFVTAFVSALLAVRLLLAYVATRDFRPFGWYRIAVGFTVLATYLLTA